MNLSDKTLGLIGLGNMGQAILSAWMKSQTLRPDQVVVHNRTPGKAKKMVDRFGVTVLDTPEAVVERSDIIVLATKPQDLLTLIEPLRNMVHSEKTVVSMAAGISLQTLRKYLPDPQWIRIMPNTPVFVQKGVIGFCLSRPNIVLEKLTQKLFSPLGHVILAEEGEEFSALTVASASGTGFILELMQYWQDWVAENGVDPDSARKIVIETFLGTAQLAASEMDQSFEQLSARVASKKGVTAAGLESMRELELEGIIRMSFNKALMREHELAKENS